VKYKQSERQTPLVEEPQAGYEESPIEWVERIMAGLPVVEFDALRELLGLPVDEMARKIGISTATLSRRRAKAETLDTGHSDRLMRYARLYWQAVAYFDGARDAARKWLASPARALNGQTPLDFAETEMGAREVEDLLGRLEHGVYV